MCLTCRKASRRVSVQAGKEASVSLPSRAQVVVCGGGVVGSSVCYHLPKYGFKDVIHLEQGRSVIMPCLLSLHVYIKLGKVQGLS